MTLQFTPEPSPPTFDAHHNPGTPAYLPNIFDPELAFFPYCPHPNFPGTTLPRLETLQFAPSYHQSNQQITSGLSSSNRWTSPGNTTATAQPSHLPQPRNPREVVDLTTPQSDISASAGFQQDSLPPVTLQQPSSPSFPTTPPRPSARSPERLVKSPSPPLTLSEHPFPRPIQNNLGLLHHSIAMDGGLSGFQPKTRPASQPLDAPRAKRRRTERTLPDATGASFDLRDEEEVESIDLTDVADKSALSDALAKQREDAVRAQNNNSRDESAGRSSLTSYKCPVCMDVPEDATITICGHLFCHKCIIDTLRFGEERHRNEGNSKGRGNCPVCRKPLARSEKGKSATLIPLELKIVKTKSELKGKGKAMEVDDPGPDQTEDWSDIVNWDQ